MPVNTKAVEGRRELRFESFDDLLADAERLAAGPVETLGNWSLAQILDHLASTHEASIDGGLPNFPAPMRLMLRWFFLRKFIDGAIPPGFTIPDNAKPIVEPSSEAETQGALDRLRATCERCKSEPNRVPHPGFGKITREQWDKFHFRHAEMHLGFARPAG